MGLIRLVHPRNDRPRLLSKIERGDCVLTNGFLIGFRQVGIAFAHDRAHAHLGQFFGRGFVIEQAAFGDGLVLYEGRDHFVDVFLANPSGFGGRWRHKSFDLKMELACRLVEADVGSVGVVTALAVRVGFLQTRVFRREVESRCEYLFHQKTGGDGFQRIVDRADDGVFGGIGLGDQVGEAGARLAGRIARRAADDLDDFGKARAIAESVLAPNLVPPCITAL